MSTALLQSLPPRQATPIYYPESDGKQTAETDTHRGAMNDLINALEIAFADEPDVYVTGNLMFYYVEGNPRLCTSPDVMFVRGVSKEPPRRVYKLWEEGQSPQVVIEISSRKTWAEDLHKKWRLYERLGVLEYYIFDPEYDYLPDPLLAFRLQDGELAPVEVTDGRIYSETLGLDLVDTGAGLRLFNPETQEFLLNVREEHAARRAAETELERLRAEIEQLKHNPSA